MYVYVCVVTVVQRAISASLLQVTRARAGRVLPSLETVSVRGDAAGGEGVPPRGAAAGEAPRVHVQVAVVHGRAPHGRSRRRGQLRPPSGLVRPRHVLDAFQDAQVS